MTRGGTAKPNRRRTQWLKLLVGLALIGALLISVDIGTLGNVLAGARPSYLMVAGIAFLCLAQFESFRLWIVYATYELTLVTCLRLVFIGLFFNNFTPAMVGSDVYQIQQLHTIRPGLVKPIALSFYLRFSGFAVNLLLLAAALLLAKDLPDISQVIKVNDSDVQPIVFAGLVVIFILAGIALLSHPGRRARLRLTERLRPIGIELANSIRALRVWEHVVTAGLGAFVVLARAVCLIALTLALGDSISFADTLLAVTITRVATILPVSFAGLGISELTVVAIFTASGVGFETAVAVALLARCYLWAFSLMGGAWFLFRR